MLLPGAGLRTLQVFYHKSHDVDPVYFRKGYEVKSPKQFEAEIDFLLGRLVPVTLEQLLSAESDTVIPNGTFFVSFDDGYRELADVVGPILRRKGVPATFFICSSLIDNRNWLFEDQIGLIQSRIRTLTKERVATCEAQCLQPFGLSFSSLQTTRVPPPAAALKQLGEFLDIDWDEELAKHQPYLTSTQIRELLSQGFSIGAHGIDHTVFESMSVDEQFRQIDESCRALQSQFDLSYRAFAFPYGEFGVSRDLLLRVQRANIVDCLFGTRGLVIDEFEPWLRQRLWCEGHDGTLETHLRSHLGAAVLRNWRGRNRVNRRDQA
jgi:peptidoglycan/xylan/chitin deacetylase (PgdA/CDA1 family)